MLIGKNAYICTTFTTTDKVILRDYCKGNQVSQFYFQTDCPNNAATVSAPPAPSQFPLQLFASKSGSC